VKKKTVAIAGASGHIGTYLLGYLHGYEILKINRQDFLLSNEVFAQKYCDAEFIINLTGAPIIRRWTKKNKKEILESRIFTTQKLACIIEHCPDRKRLILSASAIAIYNDKDVHTDNSHAWGTGFMAKVVQKWEKQAQKLESKDTKICIMRLGVVLSGSGGILGRLLPLFRIGLGAKIGRGHQYFSWIHIEDLAGIIARIIKNQSHGIYNMTAPGYCTNKDFTKALGKAVKKRVFLIVPKFILRMLYGGGAVVVTGGQAVIPERLIKEGYRFSYPTVEMALEDIVN
jgi:uncharacterized protein (TIGR01777 family)